MTTSPPQPPHGPYAPPGQPVPQYAAPGPYPHQPQHFQPQGQPFLPPGPQHQQPFQGQFPGQQQFPSGPGYAAPPVGPGTLQCRFCGSVPAVQATVRGHQGMIILMRFLKLDGPYCRFCGIATFRDMTAKTLWQGWWGFLSAIINPITILINLIARAKFGKLPAPLPGSPGRPMDQGKPLFLRPEILGLAIIPVGLIMLIVLGALTGDEYSGSKGNPENAIVGECVQNKGTTEKPIVRIVDCASENAGFKVVGKLYSTTDSAGCRKFEGYTVAYTEQDGSWEYVLCLAPNR